jgi:hypothetical protein
LVLFKNKKGKTKSNLVYHVSEITLINQSSKFPLPWWEGARGRGK